MASTYVNDLRLNEMATGDQSGSWGTVTNTNLELIAEAFSYGTEAITTNADTHTTTIADGGTDPGRSMFLKYTGTLDSACTITIGPNTVSKLWFIENATSGSQNIIIKQGSGATVTIASGKTKVIYSDGVGSGAKMVDAFAALDVGALSTTGNLTVEANAPYINISNTGENVGGIKMYDSAGASTQYFHLTYDAGASNTVGFDTGASGEYAFSVNGTSMFNIASTGAATFNSTIAAGAATFTTADNTNQLTLVSTDADANAGPNLNLRRNSASPADGDLTGQLTFTNNNDAGEGTDYVTIHALSADVSNGSEDAAFYIKTMSAGTLRQRISIDNNATTFNEDGENLDFRVESDNSTHMLFVDAGNNRVGIGESSPSARLEIGGMAAGEQALLIESGRNDALSNGLARINITDSNSPFAGLQIDHAGTGAAIIANGNVLVGKASSSYNTVGGEIIGSGSYEGLAQFTTDGTHTLTLNRKSSDGDMILFRKDGSTVGGIGTYSDGLTIGNHSSSAYANIRFTNDEIYPCTVSGGLNNGNIDLGKSSSKYRNVHATTYYGDGSNITGISAGRTYGTTANTTSGTSFTFTGIPAGVYEVNLLLNEVRVSGGYGMFLRLGTSSGLVSSGYQNNGAQVLNGSANAALPNVASDFDTGFAGLGETQKLFGYMKLTRSTENSNTWIYNAHYTGRYTSSTNYTANNTFLAGGVLTLGGELTQIQIIRERDGKTFTDGSATITWSQ